MKKRYLLGTMVLGVSALVATIDLQGAKPGTNEVPLYMHLTDLASDGVRGDGRFCSADSYCSGQQNVRAVLVGNDWGNFVSDTNDDTRLDGGRRLRLDFHSQPVPNPLLSSFDVDAFIGTIGATGDSATDGNLRTMKQGDQRARRARINWVQGNLQFFLAWNGPENGHSFWNFRCDLDNGSTCTQWTVTPGGTAGLYSVPTKGNAVETFYGSYTMPSSMTLTKQ